MLSLVETDCEREWSSLIEFDSEINLLLLSLLDFDALRERLVSVLCDCEPLPLMLLDRDSCFETLTEPDRLAESLACLFDSDSERLSERLLLVAMESETLAALLKLSDWDLELMSERLRDVC